MRPALASNLTPDQQALLDRFGYPYVMEQFRFHMTLTDRLATRCEGGKGRGRPHLVRAGSGGRAGARPALPLSRTGAGAGVPAARTIFLWEADKAMRPFWSMRASCSPMRWSRVASCWRETIRLSASKREAVAQTRTWAGDYLLPGLVELHTDHLETITGPPGCVLGFRSPRSHAHDVQVIGSGITTPSSMRPHRLGQGSARHAQACRSPGFGH